MILIFLSYRSGKTEQTGIRSSCILEFLAEFRMMRNSAFMEVYCMRNSASCGTPHHAELRIMQNSASCGTPHAIFRKGLEAFAEKCPNTPQICGTPHWISASCGVLGLNFRMMRNSAVLEYLRNSARCGKVTLNSPHLTSLIF